MASDIKATIFIPTYNGETYLQQIFDAVFSQKVDFMYDVLVIDSGSKDRTIEIIAEAKKVHDNLTFKKIPNAEYGHGKTRNLAAQIAKGEIVVYISHDAIPSHDRWLYEMLRPFEINGKIVGVMGSQIPRANCIPMLKAEINSVFKGLGPGFGTTIFYKDDFVKDQGVYDAISFYSDANSAAKRSYLTDQFPYSDVPYAEDQLLGRDIIDAGYYKAFAPRGSVVHSNDLLLKEYKKRMFDETLGLRKIGLPVGVPSMKTIFKLTTRGILRDSLNIVKDKDYSLRKKLYWIVLNPCYHIEKWRGVRKGSTADLSDTKNHESYSLENSRKR